MTKIAKYNLDQIKEIFKNNDCELLTFLKDLCDRVGGINYKKLYNSIMELKQYKLI